MPVGTQGTLKGIVPQQLEALGQKYFPPIINYLKRCLTKKKITFLQTAELCWRIHIILETGDFATFSFIE